MAYNSSHTGTQIDDAIDKTQLMPELKGERTAYANLPGSPTTGDVYLVTTATTGYSAGFYRYNGSAWVFMGSAVTTVNTQTGAVVLDADDVDDSSTSHKFVTASDLTTLSNTSGTNTGDQDLSSYQLQPSEGAFVNGDKTKLDGIAAGAEVNVNADWNSSSGDSQILNKPTLGTAAATASTDYATAAQGATADSALQSGDNISVLTNNSGYLTAESDTLDSVTGRGATTTNGVTVGSITINGEIVEDVYINSSVTGSLTLDPANGTIQVLTLTGSVTSVTDSLANGESITVVFSTGGSSYTISGWPTTKWVGGSAPTIDTTNNSIIVLWKANSVLYGMESGVAS
jgi:hypothetical protein